MNGGGGGGSDTQSFGESFANSTGSNWNSNASDSRNINASQTRSSSGNQARSSQDVWGPQADVLGKMYGEAENQYGQAKAGIDAYTPQAQAEMQWIKDKTSPAYASQAGGGAMSQFNVPQYYADSMHSSMTNPSNAQQAYGGSADQLNQMYRRQANDARGDMMNSMDARAAASGMSGGSRHGTAIAQGNQDINQNLQNQMALASDRDVDRRIGVANQADQQLLQRQQMMSGEVAGLNQAQQSALGQANNMNQVVMGGYQPHMQGMQNLGMGSQIIGGPTALTQSGSDAWSQSAADTLGIGGTQTRGSGGGANQSDAYSWNSSQSETNPNYNFGIGQSSEP